MVLSMEKWVGKVAIVTGASSGIGMAIAEQLVDRGFKVVGVARRVEKIEEYAKKLAGKKGKLYALKGDFSKEEDILKTFKWVADNLGPVHILVNNAGVAKRGNLMDADTSVFKTVLDLNVLGLTIATREAIKAMRANNINGHIIHIGSVGGHIVPNHPSVNIYIASKHAVRALTETLRQELVRAGSKIRVTEVSPGFVETEMTAAENFPADMAELLAKLPALKAEDIADGVTYVLSTPEHVQVVGVARRVERIEEYAKKWAGKKGKLYAIKGDFAQEDDILKTFKWVADNLGPLHILINNAGMSKQGNLMDADTSVFKTVLDLNVLGLTIATREAVKVMKANNINGHIIHIGSVGGHIVPNLPGVNMYLASKHAVRALTETLRQELVRTGSKIRVTEVSPGVVTTEMTAAENVPAELIELLAKSPALEAEDIADGVTYVLSTPDHVQVHELMIRPVGEPF